MKNKKETIEEMGMLLKELLYNNFTIYEKQIIGKILIDSMFAQGFGTDYDVLKFVEGIINNYELPNKDVLKEKLKVEQSVSELRKQVKEEIAQKEEENRKTTHKTDLDMLQNKMNTLSNKLTSHTQEDVDNMILLARQIVHLLHECVIGYPN